MVSPKRSISTEKEIPQCSVLSYRCSICSPLVTYRAPDKRFSHTLDCLGRWPRQACSVRSSQAATLLEFHVQLTYCFVRRWVYVVHGPKPPLHRHNWHKFANSKKQNAFLFPVRVMFRNGCPLAVKSEVDHIA
jgi:hypothetical protein